MIIETQRLYLRPLKADDADYFDVLMKDPAVYRYILRQEPWAEGMVRHVLSIQHFILSELGFCLFGVALKETGRLAGYCGLQPLESFTASVVNQVGVSWVFHPDFWGMGLATEAGHAVLEKAFAATGLDCVKAIIHPANFGSIKVAGKLGFKFDDLVFRNDRLRLMYSVSRAVFETGRMQWDGTQNNLAVAGCF
ncbi:GNAT family N-acetyltransferase [Maridesulfovibrio sp. FT414]|uniref:GNAT family N-acetyltransferase n=1 Tax=Maridesulfovibrio sp. FT414 TaxID=2979469 RepID=UPI003D80414C